MTGVVPQVTGDGARPTPRSPAAHERPGLTSSMELPRGLLTLQTEWNGDADEFVTIVAFGGRVLKTVRTPCGATDPSEQHRIASQAHAELMRTIVTKLDARRGSNGANEAAAQLFLTAIEALERGELRSAVALMHCVADLLPDDPLVRRALARLDP